jgi:2,3-bisphosphoglycerate-independent phosphoglycerate mutase
VPFVVVGSEADHTLREGGALRDVGPTILRMLGLERPNEMDGRDLRLA